MKMRIVFGVALVLVVMAMADLFPGQAQKVAVQPAPTAGPELQMPPPKLDTGAHLNPLKIALLHWYRVNETTRFAVGQQPYGVCF